MRLDFGNFASVTAVALLFSAIVCGRDYIKYGSETNNAVNQKQEVYFWRKKTQNISQELQCNIDTITHFIAAVFGALS